MKNKRIPAMLTALALQSLSATKAWSHPPIVARVPFDFIAGRAHLPADTYTITPISSAMLRISGQATHATAIVPSIAIRATTRVEDARLVFKTYGDRPQIFLSIVWAAGDPVGYELPKG